MDTERSLITWVGQPIIQKAYLRRDSFPLFVCSGGEGRVFGNGELYVGRESMNYTIDLAGKVYSWYLDPSKRLRKVYIHLHPQEGIIVRAPAGTSPSSVEKLLKARAEWIKVEVEEMSRLCPRREYRDGEIIPYLGKGIQLKISGKTNRLGARWLESELHLTFPSMGQGLDREQVRALLSRAYMDKAKKWFPKRVERINASSFGYEIKRVSVKNQVRILGSCSNLGNLNFNWRLILAPVEVIDYVIIHELTHFKEMNHSKLFWQAVAHTCPDYQKYRVWLRTMSRTLYL